MNQSSDNGSGNIGITTEADEKYNIVRN